MAFMLPVHISNSVDHIKVIGSRVTVVNLRNNVILVDTGFKGSFGLIKSGLTRLGLSLEQVSTIVLTHYHPDHFGSLEKVVAATSASVAVHESEVGIIEGSEKTPSPFANPLLRSVTAPFIRFTAGGPVRVKHQLRDDSYIPGSEDVRIIHTPGHTAGSISLLIESEKVLIVGDALQNRFNRISGPSKLVTRNYATALRSLRKLLDFDFEVICFSHFRPIYGDAHSVLKAWLDTQET